MAKNTVRPTPTPKPEVEIMVEHQILITLKTRFRPFSSKWQQLLAWWKLKIIKASVLSKVAEMVDFRDIFDV